VVNRYLQCWDVPNVFSLGASAFPQEPVPKGAGPVGADMISGRLLYVAAAGRVDVSVAWNASAQMRSGARETDLRRNSHLRAKEINTTVHFGKHIDFARWCKTAKREDEDRQTKLF
jgi:hypothetical protein